MTRPRSPLARALSAIAITALSAAGLAVGVAAPVAAAETVAFSTMPDALAPNYASLGYQATSTDEFGDYIQLGGMDRALTTVSVGFSSWACETGSGATCATTPGATFTHPITVNIYDVNSAVVPPAVGALLATVTESTSIPFRPSADPTCAGGSAWKASDGSCNNGVAFAADFDFSGTTVPDDIIVTVAYNTGSHGESPLGVSGPYDSLNVILAPAAPTVGVDVTEDEVFWDSSHGPFYTDGGAAGTDTLRVDTGWSGYHGAMIEVGVTGATPAAGSTVTVYDKDVKAFESSETYLEWHEGKTATAGSFASVHPDGLHLADGAPATVIKGVDAATTIVSKTHLLELISSASVEVDSGSVTFQVPLFFGNPASPSFTTLRSTSLTGDSTFSQFDTWATTRAFGPYAAQDEAPLGELLDALYATAGPSYGVALAGFGVQADSPAVVPSLTWDGTSYEFFQPVIEPCVPSGGSTVTNLDSNGWSFAETRAQATTVFEADGLHIATFGVGGSPDQRKAAGYVSTDFALADAGVPELNLGAATGSLPSIQLVTDFDNDGVTDGILVGESIYGDDYWVPDSAAAFVKSGAPSHTGGFGSSNHGTLAQWLLAFPEARVLKVGYSLGSGVIGAAVIESIVAGCQTFTFTTATPPAAGTVVEVTEHDIRPNEASYPGWHEGYANPARAFSVQDDGLHLGDGDHSQILFGLDAPLATTDLESIITASSLDVSAGSVSFQFPVLYGAANSFTTLRSESIASTGERGVSVSDVWVTTRAIYAADGTTVILQAGSKASVADLVALLDYVGDVRLLGYGVQADTSAVVESLSSSGTRYVFTPYSAPSVTETVRVLESEIRPDESTYPGWHEGYANATQSYSVTEDGLVLGTPAHSQIIKGLDAPLTSPSVGLLIAGASVVVESGSVTYQVPIFYGPGTDFLTLRSESLGAGSHSFDLTSEWASSKSVPALGIVAHELSPLGDLLDKLTDVRVLAFGVQADAEATVSSIVFNRTEYVFDGVMTGTATISGTPTVGQTLTATPGTWSPADVTFSYQWKSNGAPISGATNSTYELTADDAGDTIVVIVTGTKAGYTSVDAISPGVTIGLGTLTTVVPVITGEAAIGSTLTANPGAWGPAPVSFDFQWLSDGVPIPGATDPTYLVTFSDAGKAISVTVTGSKAGYTSASTTSLPTVTLPTDAVPAVDRFAGDDRYETAVEISREFSAGVGRVYLATGTNYPDALSAAAAGGYLGAPVLLTTPDQVPAIVMTELNRLAPDEIVIVGSTASVSAAVAAQVADVTSDPTVIRIGGVDRFETSRMIAEDAFPEDATAAAYLATGLNFPDALAAGPAAAHREGPVILVNGGSSTVDAATLATLAVLGVDSVNIAGNSLAISDGIEAQLDVLYAVSRNQGANRFETAVAINEDAFTTSPTVFIATGLNFPDALAGAALAGFEDAPLYVSTAECIPESVYESIMDMNPGRIVLLGGLPSLGAGVEDLIMCD